MGPGRYGGLGATAGAAAVAFVVALTVIAIVAWGGLNRPLVAPAPHVASAAAASPQG